MFSAVKRRPWRFHWESFILPLRELELSEVEEILVALYEKDVLIILKAPKCDVLQNSHKKRRFSCKINGEKSFSYIVEKNVSVI